MTSESWHRRTWTSKFRNSWISRLCRLYHQTLLWFPSRFSGTLVCNPRLRWILRRHLLCVGFPDSSGILDAVCNYVERSLFPFISGWIAGISARTCIKLLVWLWRAALVRIDIPYVLVQRCRPLVGRFHHLWQHLSRGRGLNVWLKFPKTSALTLLNTCDDLNQQETGVRV